MDQHGRYLALYMPTVEYAISIKRAVYHYLPSPGLLNTCLSTSCPVQVVISPSPTTNSLTLSCEYIIWLNPTGDVEESLARPSQRGWGHASAAPLANPRSPQKLDLSLLKSKMLLYSLLKRSSLMLSGSSEIPRLSAACLRV